MLAEQIIERIVSHQKRLNYTNKQASDAIRIHPSAYGRIISRQVKSVSDETAAKIICWLESKGEKVSENHKSAKGSPSDGIRNESDESKPAPTLNYLIDQVALHLGVDSNELFSTVLDFAKSKRK